MMKPQRELTSKEIRSIRKLVTTKCANHDNGIRIWISQQEGIFAYEQRPPPSRTSTISTDESVQLTIKSRRTSATPKEKPWGRKLYK